jgi:tetratricopeptide (TPR) repeat protein
MRKTLFQPIGHPYYIFAPDYCENSAGIQVLHYLCHTLNIRGLDAYIIYAKKFNPDTRTPSLTPEITERHTQEGKIPITVYPETIDGNPLQAPLCVRYMLNRKGVARGNSLDAGEDDLFFWYSPAFTDEKDENFHYLTVPVYDLEMFHPDPEIKRTKTLLYVNRIPEEKIDFSLLPKSIEILSNRRPVPLVELAKKLQAAKYLYSFERSGTCALSILCGCPVIYLTHPGYEKYAATPKALATLESSGCASSDTPEALEQAQKTLPRLREIFIREHEKFWSQLDYFIQATQERARLVRTPGNEFHARMLMQQGIAAFSNENFIKALVFFSDLLKTEPQNPLPPAYLSFIAARQGEVQAAADFIDISAHLAPERADLKAALGESFLKAKRPDWAAKYLEAAISARPDLLEAYPPYARSLHLTGQSEAAIALLQSAASLPSPAQTAIHDAEALAAIHAAAPDILIDLDAYGPAERLAVFLQAAVPEKLLWGEAPMPPLSPRCKTLTGARLAACASFAALPENPRALPVSLRLFASSGKAGGFLPRVHRYPGKNRRRRLQPVVVQQPHRTD